MSDPRTIHVPARLVRSPSEIAERRLGPARAADPIVDEALVQRIDLGLLVVELSVLAALLALIAVGGGR